MHDSSYAFVKWLVEPPSPSGYERPIQDVVRSWAGKYADDVRTDRHGNVIAVRQPRKKRGNGEVPRVMLAGHCDQLGLMIQHVDENGFLYFQPIGGRDMPILLRAYLPVRRPGGPLT